jgi:nitrite reductase/ring-hydroxylating ferredoxin subunit
MRLVGSYERDLGASLDRLIENALDWEHLPHVHADSFNALSIIAADQGGWRADATMAGGQTLEVSLALDQDRQGWITETRDGDRLLSRIDSRALATGDDSCRVSVRFYLPQSAETSDLSAGAYFEALYAKLYDEDEALMIARASALKMGAKAHADRRAVTLADGSVHSIPKVCPHQGLPLTTKPDADGSITCPWHGYQFDVRTGLCVSDQPASWARI